MGIRKGVAGLVVLILVLGYMMSIATSHSVLMNSEAMSKSARLGYKRAHFAAVSAVGIVMARLRTDSANTFETDVSLRPYFVRDTVDNTHYVSWSGTTVTAGGYPNRIAAGWLALDAPDFAENIGVNNEQYEVIICSYPGDQSDTEDQDSYYVKAQGRYTDGERVYRAQVWAKFSIKASAKLISFENFNTMSTQPLDIAPGLVLNDFWDWQNMF